MKGIYKLMFLALLGTAVASAQTTSSQSTPDQSQQQPPSASSPQSQYPNSSAQSGTGQASPAMSSSEVKTAIRTAFQQDSSLSNSGISVSVSKDKVTLSGTANSSTEKDKAQQIAETNAGSRQVVNNIKVSASSETTTPK
jgi:hyperosmotically inducible protein